MDEAVNKCLISVANSAMTKVAFGALGCGLLMYPPDIIAETMFDAVINFDTNRHGGSDLHVSFVVYTDDESVVKVCVYLKYVILSACYLVQIVPGYWLTDLTLRRKTSKQMKDQMHEITKYSLIKIQSLGTGISSYFRSVCFFRLLKKKQKFAQQVFGISRTPEY